MDQVHAVCRRRHLSPRTEEAYRYWIRQFIFFHGKRHPRELREAEVTQFLNHLAVQRHVAASTQTQALNAIVFLYRDVLVTPLGEMGNLNRVQQRKRIPVVMASSEVSAVLSQMSGMTALMAQVMFGSGLRVEECCTLRVKDIDFVSSTINIRDGKRAGKTAQLCFPADYKQDCKGTCCKLHNYIRMTERVALALHRFPAHLNENIRRRPNPSLGSSRFRLRYVDLGDKAGVLPVGTFRLPQSSARFVRRWRRREF